MKRLFHGDCLDILPGMGDHIDCIFADWPDNIGLKYEGFNDKLPEHVYVALLGEWMRTFVGLADTTWVSFNAKWTAEMGVIARKLLDTHEDLDFKPCVQTFTFGQHNQKDFGNNHRPLWRFRRENSMFYPDQIRIESERQKMGDKRADPRGRVPGDVAEFESRDCLPLPSWTPKDIERFLSKIQQESETECWEWTCNKRGGYGRFRVGGRKGKLYTATRLMWRLSRGSDPLGQLVCHTCDNPSCCNPSHLFLGSDADNNADKERKARGKHPVGVGNGLSKLSEEDVINIFLSDGSNRVLAKKYNVTDVAVSCIRHRKTWTHITDKLNEGDVFRYTRVVGNSKQRRKWHKTQLNEGLVERCILSCTEEGDHVVDPFAGTGTTLRVCEGIGRKCTTMDISRNYCERIAKEHGLQILNA